MTFSDIQNLFSYSHFVEWRFLLWVNLRTLTRGHCRVAMTAAWKNRRRRAVRVHLDHDWVPFLSQKTTMSELRRMAVLVRQSIWKMVGANTYTYTIGKHLKHLRTDQTYNCICIFYKYKIKKRAYYIHMASMMQSVVESFLLLASIRLWTVTSRQKQDWASPWNAVNFMLSNMAG